MYRNNCIERTDGTKIELTAEELESIGFEFMVRETEKAIRENIAQYDKIAETATDETIYRMAMQTFLYVFHDERVEAILHEQTTQTLECWDGMLKEGYSLERVEQITDGEQYDIIWK